MTYREFLTGYVMQKITVNFAGKQTERFVRIASLEKAFFDFIYFGNKQLSGDKISDYRFDNEVLASVDKDSLYAFIQHAGRKSLASTRTNILKHHDVIGTPSHRGQCNDVGAQCSIIAFKS